MFCITFLTHSLSLPLTHPLPATLPLLVLLPLPVPSRRVCNRIRCNNEYKGPFSQVQVYIKNE